MGGGREGRWGGGAGGAMGGGREGRLGGGSRWGDLGWWGGGAQAPVTSPCPPSRVRARTRVRATVGARVRVTELVEPVLVL